MAKRPAFQHQGPDNNCVIDDVALGWVSCTAYAMAMLIDAATDGTVRPKGCRVRRRVTPRDVERGLTLRQVADVAEREYDVVVSVRTGPNAIPVAKATQRIRRGRGFLLQGNNVAFGLGNANHAIYVHQVRGGTPESPAEALVYDPQRKHEAWIPWHKVLAFGAALRLNKAGTRVVGPKRLYAGFAPRPTPDAAELAALPPPEVKDGVELRFGARRLPQRKRTVAKPPPGRRVNVRRTPRSLEAQHIVDTLAAGELFVAFQRLDNGERPAGSTSTIWFGNRRGTEWVHSSGLRRAPGAPAAIAGPPDLAAADAVADLVADLPDAAVAGTPADDSADDELDAEAADLPPDVREDDLTPGLADPGEAAPTSDPNPDDEDGDFVGRPLTDDELALLPVE